MVMTIDVNDCRWRQIISAESRSMYQTLKFLLLSYTNLLMRSLCKFITVFIATESCRRLRAHSIPDNNGLRAKTISYKH